MKLKRGNEGRDWTTSTTSLRGTRQRARRRASRWSFFLPGDEQETHVPHIVNAPLLHEKINKVMSGEVKTVRGMEQSTVRTAFAASILAVATALLSVSIFLSFTVCGIYVFL